MAHLPERESLVTFLLKPFDGGTELTQIHEHLHDDATRKSHKDDGGLSPITCPNYN
jgi:hypothetical protein